MKGFIICQSSGFVLSFIYLYIMAPHCKLNRFKSVSVFVLSYVSSYALMLWLKYIITGEGGQNAVRIIVFIPLFIFIYSSLFKLDYKRMLDFGAAAPMISFGVGKYGCVFAECCHSWLEVDWGVYNGWIHKTLFPLQFCEATTAVLIAIWAMWYVRKKNYDTGAKAMAISYIVFGITRFGWEFLRDNEKLFWGISELALWALAAAIWGAIYLYKITKEEKVTAKIESTATWIIDKK